jgi:hypothetical protein
MNSSAYPSVIATKQTADGESMKPQHSVLLVIGVIGAAMLAFRQFGPAGAIDCAELVQLGRPLTRDEFRACMSDADYQDAFGRDGVGERRTAELRKQETASWFGKTGLPSAVERNVPEYVRLEFGESLDDDDGLGGRSDLYRIVRGTGRDRALLVRARHRRDAPCLRHRVGRRQYDDRHGIEAAAEALNASGSWRDA